MKAHLAFQYQDSRSKYQKPLWEAAIKSLSWEIAPLEDADFAIMWGPQPELNICLDKKKSALVVDYPYWNRGWANQDGKEYYKVSLNGQHPTPYLMEQNFNFQRYKSTRGPDIKEWRKTGDYILLAGTGYKAALQHGYMPGQWEMRAARAIQRNCQYPVLYRPKPRQNPIPVVPGVITDIRERPIEDMLGRAFALVCHHGNTAVDALAAGVPIFMNGMIGAAAHLACHDLEKISEPYYPANRHQFFNNLAHWQWSVEEIASGAVLHSYRQRQLI